MSLFPSTAILLPPPPAFVLVSISLGLVVLLKPQFHTGVVVGPPPLPISVHSFNAAGKEGAGSAIIIKKKRDNKLGCMCVAKNIIQSI